MGNTVGTGKDMPAQEISTVETPTIEAAVAPMELPFFQNMPPTKGIKHAAARKEYTEFSKPRMLEEDRARIVDTPMKPMLTPRVIFFS